MGGIIIILGTLIPVLLLANFDNIYINLLIFTTLSMGAIGLIDDYIKIFKKDKDGLKGKFKVAGQLLLGLVVGLVLYFHPGVTVKEEIRGKGKENFTEIQNLSDEELKLIKKLII